MPDGLCGARRSRGGVAVSPDSSCSCGSMASASVEKAYASISSARGKRALLLDLHLSDAAFISGGSGKPRRRHRPHSDRRAAMCRPNVLARYGAIGKPIAVVTIRDAHPRRRVHRVADRESWWSWRGSPLRSDWKMATPRYRRISAFGELRYIRNAMGPNAGSVSARQRAPNCQAADALLRQFRLAPGHRG